MTRTDVTQGRGSSGETRVHLGLFHKAETGWPYKTAQWTLSATVRGRYLGTLMKGWWRFGHDKGWSNPLALIFAIGGEDNMLQVAVTVPFLGHWAAGVRVPRWLTNGWVYQRREWGIRFGYVGSWAELFVAFDSDGHDMADYYRRKVKQGTYDGPWSRAALWPGWHFDLHPRPLDRLFGRLNCETTTGEPVPVEIPMPEGKYPATMTREERVWKRPRWPWIKQRRVDYSVDMEVGIPFAGKGENSWDCGDDALFGTGGSTPAEAIGNVVKAVLRNRANYGEASAETMAKVAERIDR